MKHNFLHKRNLFFLWVFLVTSCVGQPSTNQRVKEVSPSKGTEQHSMMIRMQETQSGVVSCELLDKGGNLWFSINGEGAYRYDGKEFTNFTTKDGLCSNNVGAIIQNNAGSILFATDKGICSYDGKVFKNYPVPDTLGVTCMFEDKEGNLWFGTGESGIYRYNGKTLDNFLNSTKAEYNLGSRHQLILDILQDKNGNLWFSSWNGGGVWKYDGKDFVNFVPSQNYYKTNQDKRGVGSVQYPMNITANYSFVSSVDHISDDMIFSMTEDSSGNIWFATRDHGLCIYNGSTFASIGRNEGFNSRGATAVLQDNRGFWITTVDCGVWYYDGKSFENFTEKDGLVNNAVMSVLKGPDGSLWFGTKYLGLSRYDRNTFKTFSQL